MSDHCANGVMAHTTPEGFLMQQVWEKLGSLDRGIQESQRNNAEFQKTTASELHELREFVQKQTLINEELVKLTKAAFPGGDADGHRRAHEMLIKKDESDREMWNKIRTNTIGWAIAAVIGWASIALWAAFVKGPM